jgi:hypothetical protein
LPAIEPVYEEEPELLHAVKRSLLRPLPFYYPELYAGYNENAAFINPIFYGEPWSVYAPNKYDGLGTLFVNGALFCTSWPYTSLLLDLNPAYFVEGPNRPLSLELTAESAARLYVAFHALVTRLNRFNAYLWNWLDTVPYVPRDTECTESYNAAADWCPWAPGGSLEAADVMFLEYPRVSSLYHLIREFRSIDLIVLDSYMLNGNSLQADLLTRGARRDNLLSAGRDKQFPAMLHYLSSEVSGISAFNIARFCRGKFLSPSLVRKFKDEVLTADMRANLRTVDGVI